MDQNRLQTYQEVRKTLIERLTRLSFTETMLEKMCVFQLVSLLHLMAGHLNYLPTFTIAVRTLEEMFGEIIWEKPGGEEPNKKGPRIRELARMFHLDHYPVILSEDNPRQCSACRDYVTLIVEPHGLCSVCWFDGLEQTLRELRQAAKLRHAPKLSTTGQRI